MASYTVIIRNVNALAYGHLSKDGVMEFLQQFTGGGLPAHQIAIHDASDGTNTPLDVDYVFTLLKFHTITVFDSRGCHVEITMGESQ